MIRMSEDQKGEPTGTEIIFADTVVFTITPIDLKAYSNDFNRVIDKLKANLDKFKINNWGDE